MFVPAALAGAFLLLHALRGQQAELGPLVGIWSLPTRDGTGSTSTPPTKRTSGRGVGVALCSTAAA
jgi:hypothetical protein